MRCAAKVLALDMDGPPRGGDGGKGQRLHLPYGGLPGKRRLCACDGHLHVPELRRERLQPPAGHDRRRGQVLSGGLAPALAPKLTQRPRRVAVHRRGHVVPQRIGRAMRVDPMRLVVAVRPRVPTAVRDVDAAAKRERIVDDQDFLVVAAVGWMVSVQPEMQAAGAE